MPGFRFRSSLKKWHRSCLLPKAEDVSAWADEAPRHAREKTSGTQGITTLGDFWKSKPQQKSKATNPIFGFLYHNATKKSKDYCKADHNNISVGHTSLLQVYRIYDRNYNIILMKNVAIIIV